MPLLVTVHERPMTLAGHRLGSSFQGTPHTGSLLLASGHTCTPSVLSRQRQHCCSFTKRRRKTVAASACSLPSSSPIAPRTAAPLHAGRRSSGHAGGTPALHQATVQKGCAGTGHEGGSAAAVPTSTAVHNDGCPSTPSSTIKLTRRSHLVAASSGLLAMAAAGHGPVAKAAAVQAAEATDLEQLAANLERRVSEKVLDNGLRVIVLERHVAPVVSCHTYANVGAFDEVDGQTGIAHLLEHMAFKGTQRVGTLSYEREAPLLDAVDEVFYRLRDAGPGPRAAALQEQLERLQRQAEELVVPNAFGAELQRQGAVGLNAATSHDATRYYVSLPSNKLELWWALEAERFRAPVLRQLYSEKKVVAEERRLRVDNSPLGRFQEAFDQQALANNYRRPVIGYAEDVDAIGRREVASFFGRYYGPRNLTIAVVGDVEPAAVFDQAERYFGGWRPDGVTPLDYDPLRAQQEPLPKASRRELSAAARGGPGLMLGFYRPPINGAAGVTLEVLSDVLSGGRTSRFFQELILPQQVISASITAGYPGEKHAGMMLGYAIPLPGESLQRLQAKVTQVTDRLCQDGLSEKELRRSARAAKMQLLTSCQSNTGLSSLLCSYHVMRGSWRGLIQELQDAQELTADDVQAAAQRVFTAGNSFVGYVEPLEA